MLFPVDGPLAIARYSYWQVLSGEIGADQLSGKVLVVGLTADGDSQSMSTPQREARGTAGIVASFASSLTLNRMYDRPVWGIVLQWVFALGVLALGYWLFPQVGAWMAIFVASLLASALLFIEVAILNMSGAWLQFTLPATALLTAALGSGFARATFRLAVPRNQASDPVGSLRTLGLTFQSQGQLDLAYETFRRCPPDKESIELIFGLALDYERRRQFGKAADVYGYIVSVDANFKDASARRERMKRSELALNSSKGAGKADSGSAKSAAVTPLRPAPAGAKSTGKQTLGRYEIERELWKKRRWASFYLGRDPKNQSGGWRIKAHLL